MGRLISAIALSGALSVASGFSASEPARARRIHNNNFPQHASVPSFISSTHHVRACPVGRRNAVVANMTNNNNKSEDDQGPSEDRIEDAIASGDAFSFILFPSLVLKFIAIMIYKSASDFVEYTPQYFERIAGGGMSLGEAVRENHPQADAAAASGNTMAINPEAHHHGGDDTGFSDVLGLPTLFLKFIVIMMVKSARDAVYYPSQYLERLFKPSQEGGGIELNPMTVEEATTVNNSAASSEEQFIEEAAFSLFLLPVLLLKFSIVMLVKVAKDMVDYTLPYLESLARLDLITNDQNEDIDEFADISEVLYTKDGDYWIKK